MFINKNFKIQKIAGNSFVFFRNGKELDMTQIMSFNKSSVWLWEQLEGKNFSQEDAFLLVTNHYDGDHEQIKENLMWWISSLMEAGIIEK